MATILEPSSVLWRPTRSVQGIGENRGLAAHLVGPSATGLYLARRFLGCEGRPVPGSPASLPAALLARRRLHPDADLLVTRLSPRLSRLMSLADALRVPERVTLSVDLPIDVRKQARRHNRDNLRLIRRHRFDYAVTRGLADFDRFFHHMYVPYARARFGDLTQQYGYDHLRRIAASGATLWIQQNDCAVAGAILEFQGEAVRAVSLGIADADPELRSAGVISAFYLFTLEWAMKEGFTRLKLGGARPSLADGVVVTKRRWGARLDHPQHSYELLLQWTQCDGTVRRFLHHTPLFFRDRDGLAGMTALVPDAENTETAALKHAQGLWVPGLRRLIVITDPVGSVNTRPRSRTVEDRRFWRCPPGSPRQCVAAAQPLIA